MQIRFNPLLLLIVTSLFFLFACAAPISQTEQIQSTANNSDQLAETSSNSQAETTDCASPEKLCVGFLVEADLLAADPFYQAAQRGVERTHKDLLATVTHFELDLAADDVFSIIDELAADSYDIVVTAGPNLLIETLGASQKYPNINFVGVDQDQFLDYDNIIGIAFEEQEAAFLAGSLAAMVTKSNKVGIVLGEVPPSVYRYLEGFEAGVSSVKPTVEVMHAFYSGDNENAYSDPKWGREMAKTMLSDGADVIFASGGQTAVGALIESAESPNALCIGADLDDLIAQTEARPCLISVIVRNIESKVFESIAWSSVDKFPAENVKGDYLYASFYTFDKFFTADISAHMKELETNVAMGNIPVDGSYVAANSPKISIQR